MFGVWGKFYFENKTKLNMTDKHTDRPTKRKENEHKD